MASAKVPGRNIRPKTAKLLPVVDYQHEQRRGEECPDCDGGQLAIDCEVCTGNGCDDEGNPCKTCNATGMVWIDCAECEGTGYLADDEDG